MAIQISKGQKVNLTKDLGLRKVKLGLGWNVSVKEDVENDLDLSLFLCGKNGLCVSENHFIFYNNLKDPEGAVEHMGDNRIGGEDDGEDEEEVIIDFTKISDKVKKIIIVVTIYDARNRRQNFGMVRNAYARLINTETDKEELRYDLTEDFSFETSVVFAEISKTTFGQWRFTAVGEGCDKDLTYFCHKYGLETN